MTVFSVTYDSLVAKFNSDGLSMDAITFIYADLKRRKRNEINDTESLFIYIYIYILLYILYILDIFIYIAYILYIQIYTNWDSLHARLRNHQEACSYKKKAYKKIKVYRKSV